MELVLIFIVVIVVLAVYGNKRRIRREQAMSDYAAGQGWQPIAQPESAVAGLLPDALRGIGFSERYDMAYQLTVNSHKSTVFEYEYEQHTQGYGTSDTRMNQVYSFAVVNVTHPQKFDSLYVRRRDWGDHTAAYKDGQKLQLEGDFGKSFDVYAPNGTQIDALDILTPDIMQCIQQHGSNYDVQFQDHTFTVIADGSYMSPGRIGVLLGFAAQLAALLDRKPVTRHDSAPVNVTAGSQSTPSLKKQTLWDSTLGKVVIIGLVISFVFPIVIGLLILAAVVFTHH